MQKATLTFIQQDNEILLIKKKRGIGKGLYNGPGGKVEENETPKEAAKRELKEETKLTTENLDKYGILEFYFGKEPFMKVHIFKTTHYKGKAEETDEAKPKWFPTDEIPYEKMWPDDKHWLPLLLEDKKFKGEFNFDEDGEKIHSYELEEVEEPANN